jgi:hypothetical protein
MRPNPTPSRLNSLTTELVYRGPSISFFKSLIVCTYSADESQITESYRSWSIIGVTCGVPRTSELELMTFGRPDRVESSKIPHMHHIEVIAALREKGFRTSSKTYVHRSNIA